MKAYCVSCEKNTSNKNSIFKRTKQNRLMLVKNRDFVARKNQGSLVIKKLVGY